MESIEFESSGQEKWWKKYMDCRRLGVVIATDTIITSNPPAVAITGSESPVALAGRNVTTEMGLVTGLGFLFSSCKREKISLLVLTLTRPTSNLTLMCHIHEEMIKDRVRTETYRTAILQHQDYIEDKVVVDVGCGTGILSIFCAQAGAKRVYAVDASEIALQANEVVKANNLSETVIVLHGRVEDVEIEEEVDVIISEWMGYMLLYESMLGSVITARDRWLKPGGLILPSSAKLYMAPVTHPDRYSESIDFWRNVYGIDMSAMLPLAKQCAFEEPSVETISGENVLTWPHVVKHVDCYTITIQELESVTTRFKFQSMMRAPFHGFAFWFDVEFSGPEIYPANSNAPSLQSSSNHSIECRQRRKRANPNEALVLSTAPEDPPTHWQQTLIYFYDPIDVEQDQHIEGYVTLSQSKENRRFMNIHLEYASGGRSFVKESVMR